MEIKDKIIEEIKKIYDPEIPVNIYELGLIYKIVVDKNNKVKELTFEGSGCAISMASTSIMTELVKDKSLEVAKKLIEDFLTMIKSSKEMQSNDLDDDQKTKIMSLSGVKQYPMRVKCATLAWHTLTSAITNKKKEVNTETID